MVKRPGALTSPSARRMGSRDDSALSSHSQANEDVGVPRANEDVGVPKANEDVGVPGANPDDKHGDHVRQLISHDKAHLVGMTGSYFRCDTEAVLHWEDESRFETVTITYYEQLKRINSGYYFYSGAYADEILNVLDPREKVIENLMEGTLQNDRYVAETRGWCGACFCQRPVPICVGEAALP